MNTETSTTPTTALWLGDLHLDRASEKQRMNLLNRVYTTPSDCVVVSGDISIARHLEEHLRQLASACAPRPVFFVPGNHDYHGAGMHEVETCLAVLCASVDNLHYLDGRRIIPLGGGICLIGHGGWADARAGYGHDTVIDCPDRHAIDDFCGLSPNEALEKMTALGKESAGVIRNILPLALTRYRHVLIVTHVPTFPSAVRYNHKPCADTHLPFFVNLAAGLAILGISRAFPQRQITILAGHAHSRCEEKIRRNLSIRVGHARTGSPGVFDVIKL